MKPYSILFIVILFSCGDLMEEIKSDPCNDYVCEYSECDVIKAKHQLLTEEYETINSYISGIASATKSNHDCASNLFMILHGMNRKIDDIQYQIKQLEDSSECI